MVSMKEWWLRKANMYSLKLLDSTHSFAGTYSSTMVPKSGCPVTGHSDVNSGKLMLTT